MLSSPPSTAPTMAARKTCAPMAGNTPVTGLINTPAMAASAPAPAQLSSSIVRTGMPASAARSGSSATAAMALPTVVREKNRKSPAAATASTAITTSEFTGNVAPPRWMVSSRNSQVSAR